MNSPILLLDFILRPNIQQMYLCKVDTPAISDTYKTPVFIFILSCHPGFWETTIEVLVTIIPGC